MTRRKGVFSWEHEPADERPTEFEATVASDWRQTTNSTFAEPSRLDRQRVRRHQRRRVGLRVLGMGVALALTLVGLAVLLSRVMSR
jgi:hypothetical protein